MNDEAVWKQRFLLLTGARLFGLAMFLGGIAIIFTDLVREGGRPTLGAIIAMLGAIDSVFAPKLMKKAWDREDRERGR